MVSKTVIGRFYALALLFEIILAIIFFAGFTSTTQQDIASTYEKDNGVYIWSAP